MREQRHQETETTFNLQLRTYEEAVKTLPYLRSIVRSLREHWLEARQARQQVQRLDARPGRPDRQALLLRAEANREAERTEERFEETRNELLGLGVSSLDPAKGLALIPFRQGEERAWFVFDLFAPQGVLETRRPLGEELDPGLVDQVFAQRQGVGEGA